jgi:hypothetical protein
LETDFKKLRDVVAMISAKTKIPDYEEHKAAVISDLRRHTLLINVECRRRGFLQRVAAFGTLVLNAYGVKKGANPEADQKQNRLSEIMPIRWIPVADQLDAQLANSSDASMEQAVHLIEQLASMNAEIIGIATECLARLAQPPKWE